MDSTAQWTQEFNGVAKSMVTEISSQTRPVIMERKIRPQKEVALNCPRCHSTNTKFCYYNNYSLTQPRYFCKTCRRYWTQGGTLRNVPVGGGSRKNTTSTTKSTALKPTFSSHENPKIVQGGQHLNLGFQLNNIPLVQDYNNNHHQFLLGSFPKIIDNNNSSSALNFVTATSGLNSFFPMAPISYSLENTGNNALFAFHEECKPSDLAFSIDIGGINNNNNNHGSSSGSYGNIKQENINGSLMFALGATKRHDSTTSINQPADQEKGHQNSNGFWNGMLGGGGSW